MGSLKTLAAAGLSAGASVLLAGCDRLPGCEEYGSEFSCSFVVEEAEYEVWYWRNLEQDRPEDDTPIGRAVGLRMCRDNAQAFASAIGEAFNERAYICVLLEEGRKEKHRLL